MSFLCCIGYRHLPGFALTQLCVDQSTAWYKKLLIFLPALRYYYYPQGVAGVEIPAHTRRRTRLPANANTQVEETANESSDAIGATKPASLM